MSEPNFSTWNHDTLVKFATEVYATLQNRDTEIKQLKVDLKDAINAYRELVKRNA